ncbi:MAG TPA: insulinase family protein, partial [Variovorax sp.]|nr:insulinase family protein [Variovorax sp.]
MLQKKNLRTLAAGLVLAGVTALAALPAQAAPPIQHWTLANGARVYLAATDALPIVDVQVDFDAGSRRDPPAQAGLASTSALMVEKGVRAGTAGEPALDENALGEAWADLGAAFNAGAGADRTSFNLRTLAEPSLLDRAVTLAAREIGEPAFPEDVWWREREQIGAAIREANTRPGTVVARTFA